MKLIGLLLICCGTVSAGPEFHRDILAAMTGKGNPELRASTLRVEQAEMLVRKAYAGYFPKVDLDAAYARSHSVAGTTTDSYSVGASLSQNVFDGFRDNALVKKAKAELNIARENRRDTAAKVTYDFIRFYNDTYYAQEFSRLADDILNRREANFNLVQLRFNGGREHKGSYALSEAFLKQAQLDAREAKNDLETARARLTSVVGAEMPTEFTVTRPEATTPDKLETATLIKQTPLYRKTLAETEVSNANEKIAESAFYPPLNLYLSGGKEEDRFFPSRDQWSFKAGISYPLFNGGNDYYALKAARRETEQARENLRAVELSLRADILESYTALRKSLSQVEVSREFSAAAEVRAKIARAQYTNGLLNFENWDIIENDLISRQKTVLNQEKAALLSEAQWNRLIGTSLWEKQNETAK